MYYWFKKLIKHLLLLAELNHAINSSQSQYTPAAKPRFGALPCFEVLSFFLMDSVSLDIADNQTESWNFVSVEQFKI